jgi:hypothetical protein
MWIDEIVEETRRVREEQTARFKYDLDVIYRNLKEKERVSKRRVISFQPKRPNSIYLTKTQSEAKD